MKILKLNGLTHWLKRDSNQTTGVLFLNTSEFLLLENITYNCQNPRILDLKLGFDVEKPTHIKRY